MTSSARSIRPLPRKSGVRISMRMFGLAWRTARMHEAKCSAPPSRRSSRSTEVITTYFRRMSAMVWARRAGSIGSGGCGRPWATSQNEQRRVQTSPRIMKVAVPLEKHSWMFGHEASSHTVTSEFSRRRAFSCCTALPWGRRTRIQPGLRNVGTVVSKPARLSAILSLPSIFSPGLSTTAMGMDFKGDVDTWLMAALRLSDRDAGRELGEVGIVLHGVEIELPAEFLYQGIFHFREGRRSAQV